ncbi:hypothetical protein EDC22_101127 [Tepidamorphus gemmatus]|uniref:Outer membrane beta-barrel protein n=1 Tax=Tepidamorphus gemmatus TaxID=747076 RepID=A0A4R3MMP6_9HYPH|nr:outer membrane beta-barrel protein [Tepidamorphus gemmatus]TCT13266.1 hypothetical protein EDC22_101127 [Tepidamorphus gemmatus]
MITTRYWTSSAALWLATAAALWAVPAHAQPAPEFEAALRGAADDATVTGLEAEADENAWLADSALEGIPGPPVRSRIIEDEDPYAALGIRLGSLLLYPSIEGYLGHSSNVYSETIDPMSGGYYRVVPDLVLESDWSRHFLRGRISADHESFFDHPGETTTAFDAEIETRVDVTSKDLLGFRAAYSITPESRGDPNVPQAVVNPPDSELAEIEASYSHRFGRVEMAIRGGIARSSYDDAVLVDGTVVDNSDRNYREYAGALRTSVDMDEGRRAVFVEVGANRRKYDRRFDDNGIERGSRGYDVLIGVAFEQGEPLSGEVGIGYQNQIQDNPGLPDIRGLMIRGSLVWQPTALTTVTLDGSILPEEATLDPTASGARVYTVDLGVRHALRRNLIVSAGAGYSESQYIGSDRVERDYVVTAGLEYLVSRWLSFKLKASHSRYDSNVPGEDYDETRVEAGMRLQR